MRAYYDGVMKYETKNNLGVLLSVLGTVAIMCGLIFFHLSIATLILVGGGVAAVGYGFYYMTRGFTDMDKDHPDYHKRKDV